MVLPACLVSLPTGVPSLWSKITGQCSRAIADCSGSQPRGNVPRQTKGLPRQHKLCPTTNRRPTQALPNTSSAQQLIVALPNISRANVLMGIKCEPTLTLTPGPDPGPDPQPDAPLRTRRRVASRPREPVNSPSPPRHLLNGNNSR